MIKTVRAALRAAAGEAAGFLLALAAGFFLSDTRLAGVTSFADVSLAGALGLPTSAAALTGSLVHCIAADDVGRNIVKISAMIMILIMKLFFDLDEKPKACGIITGSSVFLSGMAVSAIIGDMVYKLVFYIFYGAVAGFTAYSAKIILSGIRKRSVIDLTGRSGCAYAVVYAIVISALCSIDIPVVNIGMTAGVGVTLYAAYFYCYTGGVMCGALTVCGAFLASADVGLSLVLLPAAGLLTGYIRSEQYMLSAAFFTVSQIMLTILTGISHNYFDSLISILLGALLFTITAPGYSDKWIIAGENDKSKMPELISSRLSFLSDTIGTVRKESMKIAELLSENADKCDYAEVISDEVCTRCFRRLSCLKKERNKTMRGFRKLSQQAEFSEETFPYELKECLHKADIAELLDELYRERAAARLLEMRFGESQQLMFENMCIMEDMIDSAGERIDVRYSEAVTKQVREKLSRFSIKYRNVIAYYNSRNRLHIELYFKYIERPEDILRVRDLISDELDIPLNCSEAVDSGKEIRIRLFEKPDFTLEVYGAAKSAKTGAENGDTTRVFNDGSGVSYIILSDGMGSGKSAAFESKLVVRMFRKLISSGAELGSAIKLINSIMVTKSSDESFATLDAVKVDLDTCELSVIKSGASSTLIRHRGNVLKISSPTFPVGIYEHSDYFYKEYDFEEGDIIIMFSDGISENEYLYIKELLLSGSDLKRIVDEICLKSEVFAPDTRSDDVTVIGARLVRSS